jgi:di/tricarboxylate transporter
METTALTVGHSWQMWVVLALLGAAIVSFVWERVPIEVTAAALLALLLVFFQIAPVSDADGLNLLGAGRLLEGFANPGLITVIALLIIGQALVQTGALEGVASALHHVSGGRKLIALAMSLIPVAILSSVLNNTPVVVIFIPIMSALAERLHISVSRILIPLSFASILGGMTTLIGSSTNLLVAGVAREMALPTIGFFDFVVPGAVLASVGLIYVMLIMPRLLPDRATMAGRLAGDGRQFIAQIEIPEGSALVGETAVAGMFRGLPDATVRMVQRGEHAFLPPFEDTTLTAGDVIVFAATRKALTDHLAKYPGALHPSLTHRQYQQAETDDTERWQGGEQALAEVMITPASRMIGQTLELFGFRHRFHCIVLGVQRRSRMFRQRVTDIRLEAGDVLLIQGRPEDVQSLRANRDVILVEWTQETLPNYFHARRAALIFATVVLVAATDLMPIVVAAVVGATAMILTDCLSPREAARAIDRTVVMIVAATLALGAALQETGGAGFIAAALLNAVAGAGPGWVLSALFLLIALLTNVLSNNASAVLFTPIAVIVATQLGVDPMPFVYAVIFAASCSFASPIGYQTNLLVMAPGHYRFVDYVRSGTPLIILLWLCFTLFAPWYYDIPMNAP